MCWTTRATNHKGEHATCPTTACGGVAILWARRLCLPKPRLERPEVDVLIETKLKGHLLALRVDPPPRPSVPGGASSRRPLLDRPLVVIGAYIPPAGCPWATFAANATMEALRAQLLNGLSLRRTRGAFVLVAGHFNAMTGDHPLRLQLARDDVDVRLLVEACEAARSASASGTQAARLSLEADALTLHRVKCKSSRGAGCARHRAARHADVERHVPGAGSLQPPAHVVVVVRLHDGNADGPVHVRQDRVA